MKIEKKGLMQNAMNVSVGLIEEVKTNDKGYAKYKVIYRDQKGREYSAWTNWMRDDGFIVGDQMPIKNLSVPSFGMLNIPLAVNNHPQKYVEPYVAAMIAAGIGALIAGYSIGKNSKKD